MNKKLLQGIILTLGIIVAAVSTRSAQSYSITKLIQDATAKTACLALDVVFIIDQSSSMSGSKPNDPTDQRAYAPRWAVDWLADNAYDICPEATHRIALVSFGTDAVVTKELCEIGPDNVDEWKEVRVGCKQGIEPTDMGRTNPLAAFQLADQILDDAPPAGDEGRKRVIIFMTDGVPCLQEPGCGDYMGAARELRDWINTNLPFDSTLLKQEDCLLSLRDKYEGKDIPPADINTCLDQFRTDQESNNNSTYIWTMLLKQGMSTYPNALREIYANIAKSHSGEVIDLKKNRQDIPGNFLNILTGLAGVKASRISCGNFAVNPYLSQARLTFFKIDEATDVNITYEDATGNSHKLVDGNSEDGGFDVAEWYSEGTNERYVLNNPYPGIWRIESDACQDIDAYYEEVQFDIGGLQPLKILTPDGQMIPPEASFDLVKIEKYPQEPYIDPENPYYLQFTMHDTNGETIKDAEDPFFGVTFTVNTVDPTGNEKTYEMEWKADQSLYQSSAPVSLPSQGEYQISILGNTFIREYPYGPLDRDLSKEKVFNTSRKLFSYEAKLNAVCPDLEVVARCPWATYVADDGCSVCPLREFEFKINAPPDGTDIGPVHKTILSGWPLKVNSFDVTLQFQGADGNPINLDEVLTNPTAPLSVKVSNSTESRPISLTRNPANPLQYLGTVENMTAGGQYHLEADLTSQHSEFYRAKNQTAEETFMRTDGRWNNSVTYRNILLVLFIVIVLLILRAFLIRTNKVKGVLVFTDGSTTIAEFPLNSGKNWIELKSGVLKRYPQLDLSKLRVKSLPKKKLRRARKTDAEDQILTVDEGETGAGVQVTGRTSETKSRFNFTLSPDQATDYSAESVARMEYKQY